MFKFIAIATMLLTTSAFAQSSSVPPDTTTSCVTQQQALDTVLKQVPDATVTIKNDSTLKLESPSRDTDLLMFFDGNGCLVNYTIVTKVAPGEGVTS